MNTNKLPLTIPVSLIDTDNIIDCEYDIPDITTYTNDVYGLWCLEDELNPMVFTNAINAGFTKFAVYSCDFDWSIKLIHKYKEYIDMLYVVGISVNYMHQTDIFDCDWKLLFGYSVLERFMMDTSEIHKVDIGRWVTDYYRVYYKDTHFYISRFCNDGTEKGYYFLDDNVKAIKEKLGMV